MKVFIVSNCERGFIEALGEKWAAGGLDVHSRFVGAADSRSLPENGYAAYDLVYLCIDGGLPGADEITNIDVASIDAGVVLDIARCSLKIRSPIDSAIRGFLRSTNVPAVVRDVSQLADSSGRFAGNDALVVEDYGRFSYPTTAMVADTLWYLRKVVGEVELRDPPTSYLDALLLAPPADPGAKTVAEEILEIDPNFFFASIRLRLGEIVESGKIPREIEELLDRDPLGWQGRLALLPYLKEGTPLYDELQALSLRVLPGIHRSKRRVLIFVLRKQRDLFIDLMIGQWLEELGHEVVYRPLNESPHLDIFEVSPDAIVWGAKITDVQFRLAQFAKNRNILSIVRREEATASFDSWAKMSVTAQGWELGMRDYSSLVDVEMFSGRQFAEIVAYSGYTPRGRCVSIGSTHMDPYFLRNLGDVLPTKEDFCQRFRVDPNKKIMLFTSRWTYADRNIEEAIPEEYGRKSDGPSHEARKRVEVYRRGRETWLRALSRLYGEFSAEWNLFLKVHPGELVDEYERYFSENGLNIPVLLGEHMVEILHYTDLLIHAGSTTSVEAHSMAKPAISFADPTRGWLPISQVSPAADDCEELIDLINNTDLGRSNADVSVIDRLAEEFYGTMDGNACRRAAYVVDRIMEKLDPISFRYPHNGVHDFPPGDRSKDPYGVNVSPEELVYYRGLVRDCIDSSQAPFSSFK